MKSASLRIFRKPSVISVFALVALWNISVSSNLFTRAIEGKGAVRETAREIREVNLHLQLRFYQLLTRVRPIPFQPEYVSLAYIDDDTHWTTLYGIQPTSRAYLARLIKNASQAKTKAAAIGLDIELLAPRQFPEASDAESRATDDQALLEAIQFAGSQGVPVIVSRVFYVDDGGKRVELPNIFTPKELIPPDTDCTRLRCPSFGYINLPDDKRQIPLASLMKMVDGSNFSTVDSFSLALAKAVRGPLETNRDFFLSRPTLDEDDILGTFLPEDQYPEVSVPNLANGESGAEQACAGRVVMIGGHWHDVQGYGDFVDQHLSPAGLMSGLGLHANYLESILQHQFTHELPAWVGILIDLLVGLIIYLCFEVARQWWWKLIVLSCSFCVPVLFAFLFLDLANVYLDFLLPLELYFLHILYAIVEKYFTFKPKHSEPLVGELKQAHH
jgi:CHASE2 domain-containing sensor protein